MSRFLSPREATCESRYLKATWVLLLLLGLFPVLASIVNLVSVRGAR